MKLHLYASLPHYADHLLPVWEALPAEVRGNAHSRRAGTVWGTEGPLPRGPLPDVWLVASASDALRLNGAPYVYVEHGAGQAYVGDPASVKASAYSGGDRHERCILFVVPGSAAGARWRARYPATPVAVVGSPKLDRWHLGHVAPAGRPTVAVSFHWPCSLVPETQWALPHYRPALTPLRDALTGVGGLLLGHGHPRGWRQLRREWAARSIEATADGADVLGRADVLVADNTSLLYEVASLGRPVVVLNAPWYRRHVHHGLRFWSHVPGRQVDHPAELVPAVLDALARPEAGAEVRAAAVAAAYAHTDGHAADRAAAAIMEVL